MKKIIIGMLLFFGGTMLLLNYYFQDVQINRYTDKEAAVDAKAIEKGWVPALVPDSAYEIEETHDLDTNELFGKFSYKEADEKALLAKLTPMQKSQETYAWEDFLFKIDTQKNLVRYRNHP